MMVKEYLEQIRELDQSIADRKGMLTELRAAATRTMPAIGGSRTGGEPDGDRTGDLAVRIADLQEEISRDTDRLAELRQEAKKMIDRTGSRNEKNVLEMRYIWLLDWKQVANALHYTERNVYYLHRSGLKALEEKWSGLKAGRPGKKRSSGDFS